MFVQTWNKYLPVIKILLKRSATGEQSLPMNGTDFQRASGGRKIKYAFSIRIKNGRIPSLDNPPQLAKDLMTALSQDQVIRQLTTAYEYEMVLTNSFTLTIKNTTPPTDSTETVPDTETNGETQEEQ